MLNRCLCLVCLLSAVGGAVAQTVDDEYYPYAQPEELSPMLVPDTALFYRAVQSGGDLYGRLSDFTLPPVAVSRRGLDFRAETVSVDGVDVPYRYFAALRGLGAEERLYPGLAAAPGAEGLTGGVRAFEFQDGMPWRPYYAAVRFSGRNYLVGAKCSAAGAWGRGWEYAVFADARTGRDLYVDGVFTNALTAGFRLVKRFGEGHELALLVVVPPSVRGTRLSSSEEAFTLTGERLYNPAWGFQNGKVRNSRVRRETVPLVLATYRKQLSASTSLSAAVSAEAGISKYSMLGWYDARTPMPDNYRYLPSYTGDRETDDAWRGRDARYTQIDWDGMIARNEMKGGEAVYALEDRVRRSCNLHINASFTTELGGGLTLGYGFFYDRFLTREYKQMRDLLGADHIVDRDQFLVDDETYGNLLQNDLRHPDRVIRTGDRFGYDYNLSLRHAGVRLQAAYRADRFRTEVSCMLGDAAVRRRGRMEKELFPGDGSFGKSRLLHFTPYTLKVLAGYAFSPRSYVEAVVAAGARMPEAGAMFCQPLYNNRTVDNPVTEKFYAAEVNYRLTVSEVELQATAFVTASFDGMRTQRYFDDLNGIYCNMTTSGVGRLAQGVEAAAGIRLSYRWRLSLAVSAGRYKYIRNPRVEVISDVDNTAVDTRAESFMSGRTMGGAPQLTGCAEVSYFGPKGWGFRLSAGYAGLRYVEPELLRRTQRVALQGGTTREAFEAFTRQERLGDALTADASVFKSFYIGRSSLTVSLMLDNLAGSRDIAYNGYESQRVRLLYAGDTKYRMPHATRYTYAYPRSYYLTVSYRF